MVQRFYPAVLERGRHETYGVWFPDFPGAIAAARSQEEAMAKAQDALALAVEAMAERGEPLPAPCPLEAIDIPPGCDLVSLFAVSVEPPDPSERINVYLPKSLITRVAAVIPGLSSGANMDGSPCVCARYSRWLRALRPGCSAPASSSDPTWPRGFR